MYGKTASSLPRILEAFFKISFMALLIILPYTKIILHLETMACSSVSQNV